MAITGAPARIMAGRRILVYENSGGGLLEQSDELTVSSSDSVFGFLEGSVESTSSDGVYNNMLDVEVEEEDENSLEVNKIFWEKHHQLLMVTISRTTSLERGIREVTKQAVKEIEEEGSYCNCGKAVVSCRICLMKQVSIRLSAASYNSAICRSKWKTSPEIPSGEHTFLDVIDNSNPKRGEIRVIIELNLRAEFEMGRASEEYNQLISGLPEIFVAKVERLKAIIKIVSGAAKKCMKDKKMHMGPWRKQKYMHAKWFSSTSERMVVAEVNKPLKSCHSKQAHRPAKASMLTMALLDVPRNAVAAA